MRPPWDSERSASSDFTSLKQKKVCRSDIRQIDQLADRLFAFAPIWKRGMRRWRSLVIVLLQKPALEQQYRTYRLENQLGHSQSLVDGSWEDGFAARLTKRRRRPQPGCRWSFSSFWIFFRLLQLWWYNLFKWSTGSWFHTCCRPTVLYLLTFCSPGEYGDEFRCLCPSAD